MTALNIRASKPPERAKSGGFTPEQKWLFVIAILMNTGSQVGALFAIWYIVRK